MKAINITTARQNLYSLVNDVNNNHEPIEILGKNGSAILISAKDWKAIAETIYLNSIPGMVESIKLGSETPIEECTPLEEVEW